MIWFKKVAFFLFICMVFCKTVVGARAIGTDLIIKRSHPIVGVVIPLPEESAFFRKSIEHPKKVTIAGIQYTLGKIQNRNIVLVNSGLGKVNAAIMTARLIRDYHPEVILLSGSAGNINPELKKGDVVIGQRVVDVDLGELTENGVVFQYQDYLKNPQTHRVLPLVFDLDSDLSKKITHLIDDDLPRVVLGEIATSDALPNQPAQIALLRGGKFDVIEMEGAAVMQTCWMFDTRCIIVRGQSNDAGKPFTQQDITFATDNAAKVLLWLISNVLASAH